MTKTRAKHSPEFKAKVALAAVQGQETAAAISRRYKVHANQIYKWKQEPRQNMAHVFEHKAGVPARESDAADREAQLLRSGLGPAQTLAREITASS